jgi:hypothetical protein
MKLAIAVACMLVACGKGDKTEAGKPAGGVTAPANAPTAPAKKGVTGSVTTTGALAGTWSWQDPLAITCSWIPDLNMGRIEVTLSDGADGAMALDGLMSKDRTAVEVTSGKLKSPSPFKQAAGGVVITGTGNAGGDAPETVTAQFDAVTTNGEETLKVKGILTARCN